ncbi:hypothetical protein [Emticicia fontis]
MNYSPKLKRVMAQIKEILEKEDLAGAIVLHTKQHGLNFTEFFMKIDPSLSCAKFEGDKIRIKGKAVEKEKMVYTVNMLNMMAETMGQVSLQLFDISEMVDKKTGAKHGDSNITPDDYSNN